MKRKIREFRELMGKPVTWGGYVKLCIASLIITMAYMVWYLYKFYDGFRSFTNEFIDKLRFWRKKEDCYEDEDL